MATSTSRSREICSIVSKKDGNEITYEESNGAIVMKKKKTRGERGIIQHFVKDPIPGDGNKYKLYVYEYTESNRTGDVVEGTKFLDFNPQDSRAHLFSTTDTSTCPSQMWEIIERLPGIWVIRSEDRYLKNKGPGKPISLTKNPRKLDKEKSLQWHIIPIF